MSGIDATRNELADNLIGMNAIEMIPRRQLSIPRRMGALSYLMFLKRKRDGTIKARGCVDGRPQREYISKDESSSPTVSTYALMTTCLFDAIETRKVVTCDIPAAYLSAKWPDDVECTLKFEGAMVKLITEIEPRYEPYVILYNKGTNRERKVLYAKLTKAVYYGTLLGGILFCKKLKKQLEDWDFEMNPYDNIVYSTKWLMETK